MTKLHDELHAISDNIKDIRSVIEAAEESLQKQYERIDNIEAQVDAMFLINKG